MFAALKVQLQILCKNPASVLIMIGLTILFNVLLGMNSFSKVTIIRIMMIPSARKKWRCGWSCSTSPIHSSSS